MSGGSWQRDPDPDSPPTRTWFDRLTPRGERVVVVAGLVVLLLLMALVGGLEAGSDLPNDR